MTSRQIELVEDTWDFIILETEEAGQIFYTHLFEIAPDLKRLFSKDIDDQAKKLVDLITFAVNKLNNLDEIAKDVQELGKRHKGYNVKVEHYTSVAEALLWTLEKALGDKWNEEVKEAWIEVYNTLAGVMIEAQNA